MSRRLRLGLFSLWGCGWDDIIALSDSDEDRWIIMIDVSRQEFDGIVREAVAGMDSQFCGYLDEVPVLIEDYPNEQVCRQMGRTDGKGLLGLYRGTPLNRRSVGGGFGPSQILLYRENILRVCSNKKNLTEQIKKTLVHELGHYLGFSEKQLRKLEGRGEQ